MILGIRIRIRIILGRRILDPYPHQRSEKPDPHPSQKVHPDPHQGSISGALEAQNGAMEGRRSLFGGVEAQNGAVEAQNGAMEALYASAHRFTSLR